MRTDGHWMTHETRWLAMVIRRVCAPQTVTVTNYSGAPQCPHHRDDAELCDADRSQLGLRLGFTLAAM